MNKDSLGDRIKRNYEDVERRFLTRRTPVIIRVDGKAFHRLTKGMAKPFDLALIDTMLYTAGKLCEQVQGCKLAYVQSDEISLLLTDYEDITTESWFASNLQKMVSVSAAYATLFFNERFREAFPYREANAVFDSRCFNIPKEEVANYFIWRQQDATRNSVSMLAHANFSTKDLHGVSSIQAKEKLRSEKNIDWDDLPGHLKRGACIVRRQELIPVSECDRGYDCIEGNIRHTRDKWVEDLEIPVFTQDRSYIENLL